MAAAEVVAPWLFRAVTLGIALAAAALLLAAAYFRIVQHRLAVERRTIVVDTVVKCGKLLVAHLSDFHYDVGLEGRLDPLLDEVLRQLEAAKPDLILLTGDFVNRDPRPVETFCRRFARKLPALARHGVFASLGNHDGYADVASLPEGFASSEDVISHALTGAGVRVLRNEASSVCEGVCLCGLEDLWSPKGWRGHRAAMEAFEREGRGQVRLLMSHNPDTAQHLREYDYDVQFSGHTHGGQICLPSFVSLPRFRPYNAPVLGLLRPLFDWSISHFKLAEVLLGSMRRRHKFSYVVNHWEWAQGLHLLSGSRAGQEAAKHLSVSRGIGAHKNMRLFCPPELTLVTVVGRESASS